MDKKNANILLLSDLEYEYNVLKEAGYQNVYWFQSSLRAYDYFFTREDELRKFDIILFGTRGLNHFSYGKYERPMDAVTSWDDEVARMSFFTGKNPGENAELFFISSPNVTSLGVLKDQFLSVLNDLIPEELKEEKISLPKIEEKEVLLPKTKEDVKVLFIGFKRNTDLVEHILKEAGLTNYTYFYPLYQALEKNVERLPDYDFIIVDEHSEPHMALLDKELSDYMRGEDQSIYTAIFYSHSGGFDCTDCSIKTFATNEKREIQRYDFLSLGNEDETLTDIIKTIINMYGEYNKNIGITGYPTVEELKVKYVKEKELRDEETKRVLDNMYMLAQIHKYALEYRRLRNEGKKLKHLDNITVDILTDGVSVALILGNKEAVRLTFRDKDTKHILGSHFYLEYLSEKGKMLPAVYRNYYEYYFPDAKIENLLSEDELKKIRALYNKANLQLIPAIDAIIKEIREKQEKEYKEKLAKKYKRQVEDKKKN